MGVFVNQSKIFIRCNLIILKKNSRPISYNVLQLEEVGDFEAQNCLPPLNLLRSKNLHLTTEPDKRFTYISTNVEYLFRITV